MTQPKKNPQEKHGEKRYDEKRETRPNEPKREGDFEKRVPDVEDRPLKKDDDDEMP
jgi:hypothetical protein